MKEAEKQRKKKVEILELQSTMAPMLDHKINVNCFQ